MSELISIEQIAIEKKIDTNTAEAIVQAAKLKAHKLKIAGENLSLYEKSEAESAIQAHLNKLRDEEARRTAALEAAREPTLKEIAGLIKNVGQDIADVAELQDEIKRLASANQTIFKALIDFKSDASDRLAGMKSIIVNMRDEASSAGKKMAHSEKDEKWHAAVVGISKQHHPALTTKVGGHIALKLIEASDIRALHHLRDYDIVFAMRKHTDVRHVEQMKAVKAHIKFIDGGVEDVEYELKRFSILTLNGRTPLLDVLKSLDEIEKLRGKSAA